MLRVAVAILPLYPKVQPDLVLTGIFLHDMGKTEELSYDIAFSYTDSGQLLSHIVKTCVVLTICGASTVTAVFELYSRANCVSPSESPLMSDVSTSIGTPEFGFNEATVRFITPGRPYTAVNSVSEDIVTFIVGS